MVADLSWDIHLSDTQVWQREQLIIEVIVQKPDPFAQLKADKLVIPNMEIVSLPVHREKNVTGHEQLRIRWQIYPHAAGKQNIQLPPIRYYLNGGTRKKWSPPLQQIDVQALPPYFPPILPIGKISVNSSITPKGILQPDQLAYWHISLFSTTVTTVQFPPLLKQLQATHNVDILPSKITVKTNKATGIFRLDYHIPIKPKASGRLALPVLQWHWFDPNTARLEQVHHKPSQSWVFAWWQQLLLILISGIVFIGGSYQAIKWGTACSRRWWSQRQVLRQLLKHPKRIDEQSLNKAMLTCAQIHGWPTNFSSRQWLHTWQQYYGENQFLQDALLAHEARKFADHHKNK